jgi:glutamyl-tRNA reductase
LLAIDLAIPRDIDPEIATLSEVTLFDLEDLKRHLHEKMKEHLADLPYSLELIEEQVDTFDQWKRSLGTANHSELRQLLDDDRRMILEKFKDNFRNGETKALDAFSRNLYKQFLRRITSK